MKNLIYLILSGVLALASCSKDDPAPVEVGEVKLNKTTLTLAVGEEQPLTAIVLPDNAENKTVTWSSSDTKIATVSDAGLVTAVAVGSAAITATAEGKSATCAVTVEPITVESVTLDRTELTLKPGDSETLTATVLPDDATDPKVVWTTSAEAIATVSDAGLVTAVAPGSATITARAGGRSATCAVTVEPIAVESVTLDKTELTLKRGGTETLTATVLPDDAQDKAVAWSSSDEQVATVSDAGLVTAITAGTATITARAGDKSTTCAVIVEPDIYLSVNASDNTAFLWKNGEMTTLQGFIGARHLFLSESTGIYVVGYIKEERYQSAAVWNDGKVTKLYGSNTSANSVFVSEGKVYAAGSGGTNTAYLWVDDEYTILKESSAIAYWVFVTGGDVYVSGAMQLTGEAKSAVYWKNGVVTELTTDMSVASYAQSIVVANGNVYVAGKFDGKAVVWKNGAMSYLENGTEAYELVVDENGDVYVAGVYKDGNTSSKPAVWKNGQATILGTRGMAYAVTVKHGDVYVGGQNHLSKAAYWKNGVEVSVPEGRSVFGIAVD